MGFPMHMVPFPHWPLMVMPPPGTVTVCVGGAWEVVDGVLDVLVALVVGGSGADVVDVVVGGVGADVVEVVEVVVGVVLVLVVVGGGEALVVEVVEGAGGALGHPQVPYCGWQSNNGAQ